MVQPYPQTKVARLRRTRVRQAVLAFFAAQKSPLGIPNIVLALQQRGISVNKTSVYRELATLERAGIVSPVSFGDGIIRYELARKEHHHHAVCLSCRSVLEIPLSNEIEKIEKRIAVKTQFHVQRHELEFFGMCKKCQFSKHP